MKKKEFKMLAAIRTKGLMPLALCGLMLTGCTAEIDNPVTPDDPASEVVDPVTEEAYTNEDLMDRTVKPGDSFYDFALGSWLKEYGGTGKGLMDDLSKDLTRESKAALVGSDDPVAAKLASIIKDATPERESVGVLGIDANLSAAYLLVSSNEDEDVTVTTRDDVVNIVASLVKKGLAHLVTCTVAPDNGKFKKVLTAGSIHEDVKDALERGDEADALENVKGVVELMLADDDAEADEDEVEAVAEYMLSIDKQVFAASNDEFSNDLRKRQRAKLTATQKPSQLRAPRRAAGGADLYALLDITDENAMIDPNVAPLLNLFETEDPDNLISYLMYSVFCDNIGLVKYANDGAADDGDEDDDEDFSRLKKAMAKTARAKKADNLDIDNGASLITQVYDKLTELAPAIINATDFDYFTARSSEYDAERCADMMEQMRTLMDTRISQLDWMGEGTKAAARQKLAAMKFYIGLPQTRPGSGLTLTFDDDETASAVGAVQQLRQQHYETLMALVDDGAGVRASGDEFLFQMMTLSTCNAFYSADLNQLFILPAFVSEKLLPEDDMAMCYATAMVFGHEMSHGFDTNGAQYDANGQKKDWWDAADKAAFMAKADVMVARYNELFQYGTVHANGQKTLDENIADLGGVRLAFELFKQRLADDGATASETDHQLREFFLHCALLWQASPSEFMLQYQLEEDEHSTARNRVEGICRLMDEWYELFDVTDGRNYVAPAGRVTIW